MNRKTNLFYNSGQDSNFLTFSNYTEALTGNVIATNAKMFPAKFICLYIPDLDPEYVKGEQDRIAEENRMIDITNETIEAHNADPENINNQQELNEHIVDPYADYNYEEEKASFIKDYLVGYYENKLASLRDSLILDPDKRVEVFLNPLAYLIKCIYLYSLKHGGNAKITHIGYICEQEYNGTFMDNICVIESSDAVKEYKINPDNQAHVTFTYTADEKYKHHLYGWDAYYTDENEVEIQVIPEETGGETDEETGSENPEQTENENFIDSYIPMFDNDEYKYYANVDIKIEEIIDNPETNIKFNVLIPLFNVYNWDHTTQNAHYYNLDNDPLTSLNLSNYVDASGLILDSGTTSNHYDIPIGIWFSDKTIKLEREITSNYTPSWSLCISSQFKPFPYSHIPTEIDSSSNTDVYGSFAMIMSKQGYILDEFQNISYTIASLNSRLEYITNRINALTIPTGTNSSYNGDIIIGEDVDLTEVYSKIDTLNSQLTVLGNDVTLIHSSLGNYATQNQYTTLNSIVTGMSEDMETAYAYAKKALSQASWAYSTAYGASYAVKGMANQISLAQDTADYAYARTGQLGQIFITGNPLRMTWNNMSTLTYTYEGLDYYISIPDIIYSYILSYNSISNRMSVIDGIGLEGNNQFFTQSVALAFGTIEKKLEDIKSILVDAQQTGTINTELSGHALTGSLWADISGDNSIGTWNQGTLNPD